MPPVYVPLRRGGAAAAAAAAAAPPAAAPARHYIPVRRRSVAAAAPPASGIVGRLDNGVRTGVEAAPAPRAEPARGLLACTVRVRPSVRVYGNMQQTMIDTRHTEKTLRLYAWSSGHPGSLVADDSETLRPDSDGGILQFEPKEMRVPVALEAGSCVYFQLINESKSEDPLRTGKTRDGCFELDLNDVLAKLAASKSGEPVVVSGKFVVFSTYGEHLTPDEAAVTKAEAEVTVDPAENVALLRAFDGGAGVAPPLPYNLKQYGFAVAAAIRTGVVSRIATSQQEVAKALAKAGPVGGGDGGGGVAMSVMTPSSDEVDGMFVTTVTGPAVPQSAALWWVTPPNADFDPTDAPTLAFFENLVAAAYVELRPHKAAGAGGAAEMFRPFVALMERVAAARSPAAIDPSDADELAGWSEVFFTGLTVWSNSFPYHGDTVSVPDIKGSVSAKSSVKIGGGRYGVRKFTNNPGEDWNNSMDIMFGGDCEDTGRGIYNMYVFFRKLRIDKSASPHMYWFQRLALQYIPFGCVASVTGRYLGEDDGDDDNGGAGDDSASKSASKKHEDPVVIIGKGRDNEVETGGHSFTIFFTVASLMSKMQAAAGGRELGQSELGRRLAAAAEPFGELLGNHVGEGTNYLGVSLDTVQERSFTEEAFRRSAAALKARNAWIDGVKGSLAAASKAGTLKGVIARLPVRMSRNRLYNIPHERLMGFYRKIAGLFTGEFVERFGVPVVQLVPATFRREPGASGEGTFGAVEFGLDMRHVIRVDSRKGGEFAVADLRDMDDTWYGFAPGLPVTEQELMANYATARHTIPLQCQRHTKGVARPETYLGEASGTIGSALGAHGIKVSSYSTEDTSAAEPAPAGTPSRTFRVPREYPLRSRTFWSDLASDLAVVAKSGDLSRVDLVHVPLCDARPYFASGSRYETLVILYGPVPQPDAAAKK